MSDDVARIRVPLGKRIASHHARPVSPLTYLGWLVVAVFVVPLAYQAQGVRAAILATLAIGLWALLATSYRKSRRVELHQNGIDIRQGSQRRWMSWNQLHEVYQTPLYDGFSIRTRERVPKRWMYRLVSRDGRSIRLHDLESLRDLGLRIQEQFKRRHLPVALDAFRAGYSVRFGKHLSVSQEGIYFGSRLVAWEEIREISIDEANEIQVLRTQDERPRFRISASAVPNLPVLDGILRATQEPDDATGIGPNEPSYPTGDSVSSSLLDSDPSLLLHEGFDWDEINQVQSGQLSMDELIARGPRYRPRRPR